MKSQGEIEAAICKRDQAIRQIQRLCLSNPIATQPIMSSIRDVGSGTLDAALVNELAMAPEPLPAVWPKWALPDGVIAGVDLIVGVAIGGEAGAVWLSEFRQTT